MYVRILTGVKNGHLTSQKADEILLKNVPFEAEFPKRRTVACQFLVLYSHYLT